MRRIVLRVFALGLVLTIPLVALTARAQESTPAAEEGAGLPPGVTIAPVTQIAPVELPGEPAAVAVYRLIMEPGSAIPTHPHPGFEIVVVESGSASYLTQEGPPIQVIRSGDTETEGTPEMAGPGMEATTQTGDSAIFPAGNISDTRAGDEGVTLLIFELVAEHGEATPEA
ncbi:MAG: hypothetical protein M3Q71_11030 [Chloroflexota bacterium]|nr:hypothetical protein [Chloroflexota bacterium]MDP9471183.1 hypothetical protein [Chloroflexota bacterium]